MAGIELQSVTKRFADGTEAVSRLDLEVRDGELMVLVGPSGCGKSTTLRVIAGLERVTEGQIRIGGVDVTDRPPRERDLAMVFQSYALYPHKSVRENLAFPLRMRKHVTDVDGRIERAAQMLGITELLERRPGQLSGGQRQRVALGRAIVREPQAFLLDEPLSNLDPALRLRTRAELSRLHRRLGATMLHVTHDQEEALTLADRMAVMSHGRLEQVDAPMEVFHRPATVFVAGFVGAPPMNLVAAERAGSSLRAGAVELPLPEHLRARAEAGASLTLGVRPRDLSLVPPDGADLAGDVELAEPLGHEAVVHVACDPPMRCVVRADTVPHLGDRVGLRFPREALHLFAPTGERL